jgi:hypothetical protein
MSGIEAAVPNLDTYKYDPRVPYDREAYKRGAEARAARDAERVAKAQADFDKVMKEANQVVSDKAREELGRNIREGDVLTIDRPSTCFASVEWIATSDADEDGVVEGIVTGEFHRGGAKVYSAPMSLDDFVSWSDDESTGSWYNANDPF